MTVYVVLYIWFIAVSVVTLFNETRIYKKNGSVRNPQYYRRRYVLFTFGAIIIMLGLRAQFMGGDLLKGLQPGYLPSFDEINELSLIQVLQTKSWYNYERGYIIFNKLIGIIYNNRQFFLFACAFCGIAPIAYVVYKHSKDPLMSVIIFMGLPTFVTQFSTLRQAIAMGITFLGMHFVMEHKPIKFVITVFIASMFHGSAILFLLAYPLYYYKNTRKKIVVNIAILGAVFILRKPLYDVYCIVAYGQTYPPEGGAINLVLFFMAIYMFAALFADIENEVANGYLNLFWLACAFQILSNVYTEITRQGYYFNLALIILLPEVFMDMKKSTKPWTRYLAIGVLTVFFIGFGYFEIATTSWSVSNPYVFFWNAPKIP